MEHLSRDSGIRLLDTELSEQNEDKPLDSSGIFQLIFPSTVAAHFPDPIPNSEVESPPHQRANHEAEVLPVDILTEDLDGQSSEISTTSTSNSIIIDEENHSGETTPEFELPPNRPCLNSSPPMVRDIEAEWLEAYEATRRRERRRARNQAEFEAQQENMERMRMIEAAAAGRYPQYQIEDSGVSTLCASFVERAGEVQSQLRAENNLSALNRWMVDSAQQLAQQEPQQTVFEPVPQPLQHEPNLLEMQVESPGEQGQAERNLLPPPPSCTPPDNIPSLSQAQLNLSTGGPQHNTSVTDALMGMLEDGGDDMHLFANDDSPGAADVSSNATLHDALPGSPSHDSDIESDEDNEDEDDDNDDDVESFRSQDYDEDDDDDDVDNDAHSSNGNGADCNYDCDDADGASDDMNSDNGGDCNTNHDKGADGSGGDLSNCECSTTDGDCESDLSSVDTADLPGYAHQHWRREIQLDNEPLPSVSCSDNVSPGTVCVESAIGSQDARGCTMMPGRYLHISDPNLHIMRSFTSHVDIQEGRFKLESASKEPSPFEILNSSREPVLTTEGVQPDRSVAVFSTPNQETTLEAQPRSEQSTASELAVQRDELRQHQMLDMWRDRNVEQQEAQLEAGIHQGIEGGLLQIDRASATQSQRHQQQGPRFDVPRLDAPVERIQAENVPCLAVIPEEYIPPPPCAHLSKTARVPEAQSDSHCSSELTQSNELQSKPLDLGSQPELQRDEQELRAENRMTMGCASLLEEDVKSPQHQVADEHVHTDQGPQQIVGESDLKPSHPKSLPEGLRVEAPVGKIHLDGIPAHHLAQEDRQHGQDLSSTDIVTTLLESEDLHEDATTFVQNSEAVGPDSYTRMPSMCRGPSANESNDEEAGAEDEDHSGDIDRGGGSHDDYNEEGDEVDDGNSSDGFNIHGDNNDDRDHGLGNRSDTHGCDGGASGDEKFHTYVHRVSNGKMVASSEHISMLQKKPIERSNEITGEIVEPLNEQMVPKKPFEPSDEILHEKFELSDAPVLSNEPLEHLDSPIKQNPSERKDTGLPQNSMVGQSSLIGANTMAMGLAPAGYTDAQGNTVLHCCVLDGDIDKYMFLVNTIGMSESTLNDEGMTPLTLAASLGNLRFFEAILERQNRGSKKESSDLRQVTNIWPLSRSLLEVVSENDQMNMMENDTLVRLIEKKWSKMSLFFWVCLVFTVYNAAVFCRMLTAENGTYAHRMFLWQTVFCHYVVVLIGYAALVQECGRNMILFVRKEVLGKTSRTNMARAGATVIKPSRVQISSLIRVFCERFQNTRVLRLAALLFIHSLTMMTITSCEGTGSISMCQYLSNTKWLLFLKVTALISTVLFAGFFFIAIFGKHVGVWGLTTWRCLWKVIVPYSVLQLFLSLPCRMALTELTTFMGYGNGGSLVASQESFSRALQSLLNGYSLQESWSVEQGFHFGTCTIVCALGIKALVLEVSRGAERKRQWQALLQLRMHRAQMITYFESCTLYWTLRRILSETKEEPRMHRAQTITSYESCTLLWALKRILSETKEELPLKSFKPSDEMTEIKNPSTAPKLPMVSLTPSNDMTGVAADDLLDFQN